MFKDNDYVPVHQSETFGEVGGFGIKVLVATTKPNSIQALKNSDILYRAVNSAVDEMRAHVLATDPNVAVEREHEKNQLLSLFPSKIFVEETPNQYAPDAWWTRNRPWFVVTTEIGRFVVGWRKRVIHIDWSGTLCKMSAEKLFSDMEVTKGDQFIHAWSLVDAATVVHRVIDRGSLAQR